MENNTSPFSARDSFKGYLYQCRYALWESLKKMRDEEEFKVSIETLDDVVFHQGESEEVLQTKHSINNSANLTDASSDLWKTIRIWSEGITSGEFNSDTTFFLITTEQVSKGSTAYYIKKREITTAIERLNKTAATSTNLTNQKAYEAFKNISPDQKEILLNKVFIIDSSPLISSIGSKMKKTIRYATKKKYLDPLFNQLEGWWFTRVLEHLTKPQDAIPSWEIDAEIDMLREQFRDDNLPIDRSILNVTVNKSAYMDRNFVKQLEIIESSNDRIFLAVKHYYRAFEHRTRWATDDLFIPDELEQYEDILVDEWKVCFDRMKEKLGETTAEEVKKKSARTLYHWIETHINEPIRPGVTHPSICKGSYHMLSDKGVVGWHPDFETKLKNLFV
ncbi:ABC-three component system protein [Methanobacterium formicicum]|uniref:Uncharacterized protein n=1 Tax=Methanobacterium formicicum (strain DSM 3637 / PP1) TaxID=1204725 RepID=K2REX4_METFP|nr:ABC-three component system protein [Methanobacterium formicicum]EKF86939.1 hypothetical protein A994_01595 [Methanobacterium formicicum DSM 3637]